MTQHKGGIGVLMLRMLDEQQIGLLYESSMRRDFPENELKHLSAILTMKRRGEYDVLGAFRDGRLVAYALMYCPKDEPSVLLDYLAVEPEMRGRGIGSDLITCLRAYYERQADVLLIECERPLSAPDEAEARKRIRFYTRAGAVMTSVRIWLFDVEYSILVMPCGKDLPERNWAELMLSLYRRMLPETLYEQNVRLLRE